MAKDPRYFIDDPVCDECGVDEYSGHLGGQPLCHKCLNKLNREAGGHNDRTQEWHDRLDRMLDGTATEDDKEYYKIQPKSGNDGPRNPEYFDD